MSESQRAYRRDINAQVEDHNAAMRAEANWGRDVFPGDEDQPAWRSELECPKLNNPARSYAHQDRARLVARFLKWTVRDDVSGCLIWTGSRTKLRYGTFSLTRWTTRKAHRVAYELFKAPIPPGLELDHLCKTPSCVEPCHLEPVTHAVNNARSDSPTAINARKTECINGHPFDDENTHILSSGKRHCRACDREKHRRAYAARKARAVADPWASDPPPTPRQWPPIPSEPPF